MVVPFADAGSSAPRALVRREFAFAFAIWSWKKWGMYGRVGTTALIFLFGEGTAPDRTLSVTDPDMRYGHKSKAFRFEGFKVQVTTESTLELIVDIADVPAPGSDGRHLPAMIERVEEHAGVEIERVIGAGGHGSGPNRAWCAEHQPQPIDLVAPLAQPADPAVHKSALD